MNHNLKPLAKANKRAEEDKDEHSITNSNNNNNNYYQTARTNKKIVYLWSKYRLLLPLRAKCTPNPIRSLAACVCVCALLSVDRNRLPNIKYLQTFIIHFEIVSVSFFSSLFACFLHCCTLFCFCKKGNFIFSPGFSHPHWLWPYFWFWYTHRWFMGKYAMLFTVVWHLIFFSKYWHLIYHTGRFKSFLENSWRWMKRVKKNWSHTENKEQLSVIVFWTFSDSLRQFKWDPIERLYVRIGEVIPKNDIFQSQYCIEHELQIAFEMSWCGCCFWH